MGATRDDLVVTRWLARFRGRGFPCSVGQRGIAFNKIEGDRTTPAGSFGLAQILYRPDRIGGHQLPAGSRQIRPCAIWSDDPADPGYNSPGKRTQGQSIRFRHERLFRADPLYDIVVVVVFNMNPAVPGRGSAIFLHCWRRPRVPTLGCIAFDRHDLLWIVNRLDHGTKLVVIG
ncbi:MAG: L,D-transpeptidase family protein [Rhodobacteraceae bacterium]|nr:L,D-transpeptidase family protein [Paracoccaceae bacterium]